MAYKFTNRNIHRDLAYLYVGLIMSFALSGILMNHRKQFNAKEYTIQSQTLSLSIPNSHLDITKESILQMMPAELGLVYQKHRIRDGKLRVYFEENHILDTKLGGTQAELETKRKVPLISHTMSLHKSTSNWWIWYSDIFGLAMLVITITGIMIPVGKKGFKKRGWKLMCLGLIFPLLFLFILA